jgi:hypothetical protein
MVLMLAALLVTPQPGSLAEAGVYDCMAGNVSVTAPSAETAQRLDRRFAVTVHGLRFIESDGAANDNLAPGRDFVITDPTAILGDSGERRVAFDAAGNLVVGRDREVTIRAGEERNWYVLRGARGRDFEVRGLCHLVREWNEGAAR